MRLISARQAWREALHESRDSVLAAAQERIKLGKRGRVVGETIPSMRDSNGRCAHMLAAGLVQSAIGTLPKPLQHFGHALYSPVANGQDINVAHALVWLTVDLGECTAKRKEVAYWMALAAIKSHQAAVNGREPWGPGRVVEFVHDWYGTKVSVANWARDWSAIWAAIASTVEQLFLLPLTGICIELSNPSISVVELGFYSVDGGLMLIFELRHFNICLILSCLEASSLKIIPRLAHPGVQIQGRIA